MKIVKYEEFKAMVKKKSFLTVRMVNRSAPRRRPRDPGEAEALALLAKLSWDKAIASGKLEKKGSRQYRLNIDER